MYEQAEIRNGILTSNNQIHYFLLDGEGVDDISQYEYNIRMLCIFAIEINENK
jgi:hypothetical protein